MVRARGLQHCQSDQKEWWQEMEVRLPFLVSLPPPSLTVMVKSKLAKFVFQFTRDEEMQSFQLPLILDLIVLPTHSGPLFPSSAVVNYVHWKSIDSCSRSLGNVWTNEEERRSDLDCKKKGLGGGAVLHFVLHSLYSSSLWIQTCRSQMVKESHMDFSHGSVIKTSRSNTRGVGSTPGQGTKIPHVLHPRNQNINWSNILTNFKNGPHQKKSLKKTKTKSWSGMTVRLLSLSLQRSFLNSYSN